MEDRIHGIDWLRSLMSILVVAWHAEMAGRSLIFSPRLYTKHVFGISDLINFNVLTLAVPTFIMISCFLLASKTPDLGYLTKKLFRLLLLATFWQMAYNKWHYGLLFRTEVLYRYGAIVPKANYDSIFFLLRAGYTNYYFFVSLMFPLIIVYFANRLSTRVNFALLAATSLCLLLLPRISIATQNYVLSGYWNPLNYLPYPFMAILLFRFRGSLYEKSKPLLICLSALFVAGVAATFYEWLFYVDKIFFPGQDFAIPAYTRLSVFIFSAFLLLVALNPKFSRNRIVAFLSKHSLALYCIHPFFLSSKLIIIMASVFPLLVMKWTKFALILTFSYLTSIILGFFLRKEIIR